MAKANTTSPGIVGGYIFIYTPPPGDLRIAGRLVMKKKNRSLGEERGFTVSGFYGIVFSMRLVGKQCRVFRPIGY